MFHPCSIRGCSVACGLLAWLAVGSAALAQSPAAWEGKTVGQWAQQTTATDLGTRWYAIYALGQLGPREADAVEPLKKVLAQRSEQEYVRGTAAWALGRMRPAAEGTVGLLIDVMHSKGHISVRRNANEALGNLGTAAKPAVPELLKALGDEDAVTAVNAAVALWKIERHAKALPALVEMLRRGKPPAPYYAAVALGDLNVRAGDATATDPGRVGDVPLATFSAEALVTAFAVPDADVRRAAARSLGQIGPPALPALRKALADTSDEVRRLAAESLGWMGPAALEPLIQVLQNKSPAARRTAAVALGRLGDQAKPAEPDLVRAVNDADAGVRRAAAAALIRVRGEEAAKRPAEK